MKLKELNVNDIENIKYIILEVFTKEPWYDKWDDKEQLHKYVLDILTNTNSLALGLYDNDKLIGISLGRIRHWYTGNQFWIDDLGILTQNQGNGLGSKFIKLIEEYIKPKNINAIILLTERNVPAYYFYKKNGFNEIDKSVFFIKDIKE